MPIYHCHMEKLSKGKGASAAGFAQYLHREQPDQASQMRRYLTREGREKADLIAAGHAHLPAQARGNAQAFWLAADRAERKNGVVARVVDFAIPRELSPQAQRDLGDDFREAFLSDHAQTWAIHAPASKDGSGPQPHLHVEFSPRINDAYDRSLAQHFRRYDPAHPDKGGARKDPAWDTKGRLHDLRWGVAMLMNAALEREGIPLAVTHLSLRAQGLDRDPARYRDPDNPAEIAQTQAYRDRLHQGEKPFEQELARAAWSQQKQRAGIADISREAMIDRVRDHAFRYDRSPRRDRERQQSFARSLERSRRPISLERTQTPRERSPARTRPPARPLAQALERFTRGLGHGQDEAVGGVGLRVQLHEEEREHEHNHDRGLGW